MKRFDSKLEPHWTGKPHGKTVLWGSPVGAADSWYRYCRGRGSYFAQWVKMARWELTIDNQARVYRIDSAESAQAFMREYRIPTRISKDDMPYRESNRFDWIRFRVDWDVLHIVDGWVLDSLDCESVVIFNTKVITRVTKRREARL